ncbi:MAG: hypothetical protein Tsb0010_15020 [Parvularculaceae bacterium]
MLLSHRKQFLFIHIPKTAGTSITRRLAPHARLRDRLVYEFRPTRLAIAIADRAMRRADDGLALYAGFPQHAAIRNARDALGDDWTNALFKFAFVRDPWDWFASLWAHAARTPGHPLQQDARAGIEPFLETACRGGVLRQIDYVRRRGSLELDVDFLGRFETLREDFRAVADRLGLSARDLPHDNRAPARARDLSSLYTPSARRLFLKRFGPDLELFGYAESPGAPPPVGPVELPRRENRTDREPTSKEQES